MPGTNADDVAKIPAGSKVTVNNVAAIASPVAKIVFEGNATLETAPDTHALTAKDISVGNGAQVTIDVKGDNMLVVDDGTKSPIEVGEGAQLTLKGRKVQGRAADLKLSGKGTLVLEAPVATVTGLKIEEGGTLVVNADGVLPNFAVDTVTIADGNLTLNNVLKDNTVKNIVMTKGTLTVAGDGTIGDESTPDGEVELKAAGRLVLQKDLTLKELTTADGSTIDTGGKTLTVDRSPLASNCDLEAAVEGNLSLEMKDGKKATLNKNVHGKVTFAGTNPTGTTLELAQNVTVSAVDFKGGLGGTFKLDLGGNNQIGTLSFARTNAGLVVTPTAAGEASEIGYLIPADDAKLMLVGGVALPGLSIRDGDKVKWNAEFAGNAKLQVKGKKLLAGEVVMKLWGNDAELTLPSGEFSGLTLDVDQNTKLSVDAATQDPVLKVKKIDVAPNKLLKMNRPKTWWKSLAMGDTVVLLKAEDLTLNFNSKIEGNPKTEAGVADIEWKDDEKVLVLEAKGDLLKVPELVPQVTGSGNKCFVSVMVSGDVEVVAASWRYELLDVVAPGSVSVTLHPGATTKAASFTVEVGVGFTSGTLRVYAENQAAPNLKGFVDVNLNAVSVPGGGTPGTPGTPAGPSIEPSSWETTSTSAPDAQGNVTVQLTAMLKLEGTPKSLDVVASGMKEKPKAELLDAAGKVVATSAVPTVSATARTYKLRLTCKTTKADIDSGKAAIEKVLVTTSDGKVHTIKVGRKLNAIGKPGGGGNGGGGNGGEKKGSSGGGCDAGFGGLALALGAAFLLRKKA